MSFNGQLNMFFGKIVSFIYALHITLEILNPLNIFLSNGLKKSPLHPFKKNFKTLKFLYGLVFY